MAGIEETTEPKQQTQATADTTVLEKTLRRVSAENERLKEIASRYDAIKRGEEQQLDEERARLAQLHREAAEKAASLEAQLNETTGTLETLRSHVTEQIAATIAAAPDEATRTAWSEAVEGLEPLKQHRILAALQASVAVASPPIAGGAAGIRRTPEMSRAQLAKPGAHAEAARRNAAIAALRTRGE